MKATRGIAVVILFCGLLTADGAGTAFAQARPEGEMRWALYVILSPVWFDPGEVVGQLTPFWVNSRGEAFRRPLGLLLLHVPNHATHHRSEIATMLTMASGSPPDTGINTYCAETLTPPRT